MFEFFSYFLFAYLAFVEPFFERRAMNSFSDNLEVSQDARLHLYRKGFMRTCFLGLGFLLSIHYFSVTYSSLGFVFPNLSLGLLSLPVYVQVLIYVFMTWWISYFFIFAIILVRIFDSFKNYLIKKITPVEAITPRTKTEYFWWVMNAFLSPLEELIYRGFVFYFFKTVYPSIPIVFAIIFSISLEAIHYAPRWAAMKYVSTSALAFSLSYIIFNSVIPAMLLHLIYDLRTLAVPFHWVRVSNTSQKEKHERQ